MKLTKQILREIISETIDREGWSLREFWYGPRQYANKVTNLMIGKTIKTRDHTWIINSAPYNTISLKRKVPKETDENILEVMAAEELELHIEIWKTFRPELEWNIINNDTGAILDSGSTPCSGFENDNPTKDAKLYTKYCYDTVKRLNIKKYDDQILQKYRRILQKKK